MYKKICASEKKNKIASAQKYYTKKQVQYHV